MMDSALETVVSPVVDDDDEVVVDEPVEVMVP